MDNVADLYPLNENILSLMDAKGLTPLEQVGLLTLIISDISESLRLESNE